MVVLTVDAILFDMDGTLIDSTPGVLGAWDQFGKDYPFLNIEEILESSHGVRSIDTLRRWLRLDSEEKLQEEVTRFESEVIRHGLVLLPGVQQILDTLKEGMTEETPGWTIVTSATRWYAPRALESVGIPLPKHMVMAEDVEHGKPNPDPYIQGAKNCNVDPKNCLVVEDAVSGLKAGRAAGAKVLGVCTSGPRSTVEKGEPDYIVQDLTKLSIQEIIAYYLRLIICTSYEVPIRAISAASNTVFQNGRIERVFWEAQTLSSSRWARPVPATTISHAPSHSDMQRLWPKPPLLVLPKTAISYLLLSRLAQAASEAGDSSSGVKWVSPCSTSIYTSGDKMVASWSSPYGTASPSFQLCLSDTQECGLAVWPNVKKLADGTYTITMTIPELGGDGSFFIRMEDDDGDIYNTPVFKLQGSSVQASASGSSPGGSPSSSDPSSSDQRNRDSSSRDNWKHGSENKEDRRTASRAATGSQTSETSTASNNTTLTMSTGSIYSSLAPSPTHKALVATSGDNKPSTVAIVVPLAIFAAALAGLIFSLRQRSKAKKEAGRENSSSQDDPSLYRSVSKESTSTVGGSSANLKGPTDLERAMDFLSAVQVSRSAGVASALSSEPTTDGSFGREGDSETNRREISPERLNSLVCREQPNVNSVLPATRSQPVDGCTIENVASAMHLQHPGPTVICPESSNGYSMYQLPTIPRVVPLIDPSTYASMIPRSGMGPEAQPAHAIAPPGFEPRGWAAGTGIPRPHHWKPHPIGVTGLEHDETHLEPGLIQAIRPVLSITGVASTSIRMPVPSVSATSESLPPLPPLPASLRIAQPQTQGSSLLERSPNNEVPQSQAQLTMDYREQFFRTPELLGILTSMLSRRDRLQVLRVSRAFFGSAARIVWNRLWRASDLLLLISNSRTATVSPSVELILPNPVTKAHLKRFEVYAPFVAKIAIHREGRRSPYPRHLNEYPIRVDNILNWESLAGCVTGNPLLLNLSGIELWYPDYLACMKWLQILLRPSTRSINIGPEWPVGEFCGLVQLMAHRSPALE
ncbi:haloacid dehalogenase [Ceratobasidium sp. AG-Ba]|nr:haloacid dehalogenase [Ceratobasidium sp. AG-Ba]